MKILINILLGIILTGCIYEAPTRNEKYYQKKWCTAQNGQMEVIMPDRTRCDCLTATHAVEMDFARKWAEAIGQSLHYARLTGRYPGIVLICKSTRDRKKVILVRQNATFYKQLNFKIWTMNCN